MERGNLLHSKKLNLFDTDGTLYLVDELFAFTITDYRDSSIKIQAYKLKFPSHYYIDEDSIILPNT